MTLRQSILGMTVVLVSSVIMNPKVADAFVTTSGEVVFVPTDELVAKWQLMRANRSDSIWTAYVLYSPGGEWEPFFKAFVAQNRSKFPERLQEASDFYLREGEVYLVPIKERGVTSLQLTGEQQRMFDEFRISIMMLLDDTLRQSGLEPATLLALRSRVDGALMRSDAEAVIETVLAKANITESVRAMTEVTVRQQFSAFEASMVSDVKAVWSAISALQTDVTGLKQGQTALDGEMKTVKADLAGAGNNPVLRRSDLPEALTGMSIPATASGWGITLPILGALLMAGLALLGVFWLWGRKPWQEDIASVRTVASQANDQAVMATSVAVEAREKADSTALNTRVDELTDQVRDVSRLQVLHLEIDAQERFSCLELTDQRLKDLGPTEYLTLSVRCLDNHVRKILISKGIGGDGKPRLFLSGLERGHNFIDVVSLVALYRHLAKARQKRWISGVVVANKPAA